MKKKVVVIGGGVIGCSISSHIAQRGVDVTLIESKTLTSGTTWHAAGMVTQLKGSPVMSEICKYSRDKYSQWGSDIGWHQTGSLGVARTHDRWEQLLQMAHHLKQLKIPYEIIEESNLDRMQEIHPLLDPTCFKGAIYTPDDGIVNPADVTMRIAKEAKEHGAKIIQHTEVTGFKTSQTGDTSLITSIETTNGSIDCDCAVIAAGQWTRNVSDYLPGAMQIPVAQVSHQYVVFEKISGVSNSIPVIRDYDSRIYIKPEVGGLAVGAFEKHPKYQSISRELYDEDFDKSTDGLEGAMSAIPILEETGIKSTLHGADAHSVDHSPIIGKIPGSRNAYVCCGFNSQGVQSGYGIGRVMSDVILGVEQTGMKFKYDALPAMDVARFNPLLANDQKWVVDRCYESYGDMYDIQYPGIDNEVGRDMVLSPLHQTLMKSGAVFGSVPSIGWERPLWFDNSTTVHREQRDSLSFDYSATKWYRLVANEHQRCRDDLMLFDMSSFGKYEVSGPGAMDTLQWITSAPIMHKVGDSTAGKVVYTQFLNERAGIESDCTIVPLSNDKFYCVTGSGIVYRDIAHVQETARNLNKNIEIKDTSSSTCVLAVMGPKSKLLLATMFPNHLFDDETFPFGTYRQINSILALRISFVGELGWELHVPAVDALRVFESINQIHTSLFGSPIALGGYNAILRSLRMEKRYVHWGHDVTPIDTPMEAGLGFTVSAKLKENIDFIAREAVVAQKESKFLKKRLVTFSISNPHVSLWGHENIYRDGELCGYLSSAGVGFTTNAGNCIGIGYVTSQSADVTVSKKYIESGSYEIAIHGGISRVPATCHWNPLYDPKNERLRVGPTLSYGVVGTEISDDIDAPIQ